MMGIRLHRIWVFLVYLLVQANCLTPFPYRLSAVLFQKSLSGRHEVVGLPSRITSKPSAPWFGARAGLAFLHWVAAMGLLAALLPILSLLLARHRFSAARSLHRLLRAPLLPQW